MYFENTRQFPSDVAYILRVYRQNIVKYRTQSEFRVANISFQNVLKTMYLAKMVTNRNDVH